MKEQEEWEMEQCEWKKDGIQQEENVSGGLWGVNGDALRERNLLEATETDFLSSFFKCQVMFEAKDINL